MSINIGNKNYTDSLYLHQIAKTDIAIMGFYNGWRKDNISIRDVLLTLKQKNPPPRIYLSHSFPDR